MPRLTFSNVPTAGGGVISGNISTSPGSPFGTGGQYEAQVASIQATIAQAPPGFYDPVGWDKFLRESEQIGLEPTRVDDPEIMEELLNIPSAREAMIGLAQLGLGVGGRLFEACGGNYHCNIQIGAKRDQFQNTIALYVNRIMTEKNAPLIQAVEEHSRQLEIDQAVQIALEQAKKKAQELEMVRPSRVSVFTDPPPEEVTVAPPGYVKPEKPTRVSVFVSPPPTTVTVAPPGYVKPEKPTRVSVFDPSTESSQVRFDPFFGLLEGVFGEPTLKHLVMDYYPEPEVEPELEPELEVEPEITTVQVEPPIEPEPEEPYVFTQCVDVYRLSNGSVTTTQETIGYQTLADYVNVQKLLVRDCGRDVPTDQEVRDYYGYTEPEEPEEPYVFTQCVDVYRVGVAKSVYSVRETVGYETLSNYTGQGLLIRECGQSVPSDQEVRDHYGISAPVDPETCLCGIREQRGATVCKECPPTLTEERPVKWIPEPFFSFINEVFRK